MAAFGARLLSTLVLWGVVLAVFFSGERWAVAALVAALGALGVVEFHQLTRDEPGRDIRRWSLIVSLGLLGVLVWEAAGGVRSAEFVPEAGAVAILLVGAVVLQLRREIRGPESVYPLALALLALVYVPILFSSFTIRLVSVAPDDRAGVWLVFMVVLTAKFADMGAYVVGSLIGRHKAVPHVSPGKSWEGYGGALLFGQLGALGLCSAGAHTVSPNPFGWIGSVWHVIALALLVALAAMLGDLAESILKRSLRVKDSGQVLPGIGGVLDLIDSLCFAVPVAFLYCYMVL